MGQFPAVFPQQGLVVGNAVAVVGRGQQINRAVIKHILQAGLHIVVGKIVTGKIQQFVGDQIDFGVVVRQGANVRQIARRKHILQAGGGVIAAVGHDLDVHFRVNAVYLLNKGFYLFIRCHKGNGFVRIVFFSRFGLTAAAGGQRCRGGSNTASLQKRAAGDFLHHTIIPSSQFGYSYTPHRNSHARGLSALGIRRFSHKMTFLLYHCNKSVSSCF